MNCYEIRLMYPIEVKGESGAIKASVLHVLTKDMPSAVELFSKVHPEARIQTMAICNRYGVEVIQ